MLTFYKEKKSRIAIILIILTIFMISLFYLNQLHNFLAISNKVDSNTLIIEGWIRNYMVDNAILEIKENHYNKIIILRHLYPDDIQNEFIRNSEYKVSQRLIENGIDSKLIHIVTVTDLDVHKTFTSALTLKNWLKTHPLSIKSFNIYTSAPHARKTYMVFKRVFGDSYKIGLIPSPIEHYNARYWWSSPKGISVTMKFFIGYIYAKFWNFEKLQKELEI